MDELELTHIHPHVGDARPGAGGEQEDVSRTEGVDQGRDLGPRARLVAAHARQPNAMLTVRVLNQSRAVEPVVGRPAPDVGRAEGLDGGLDHIGGIAADRRGWRSGRKLGRSAVPASPPSSPSPSSSQGHSEHGTHAFARVAARIPEPARPAILEPIAYLRSQRQPCQRPPLDSTAHTPLGGELLRPGVRGQTEGQAGERIRSERGAAAPRLDLVPEPVEGASPAE